MIADEARRAGIVSGCGGPRSAPGCCSPRSLAAVVVSRLGPCARADRDRRHGRRRRRRGRRASLRDRGRAGAVGAPTRQRTTEERHAGGTGALAGRGSHRRGHRSPTARRSSSSTRRTACERLAAKLQALDAPPGRRPRHRRRVRGEAGSADRGLLTVDARHADPADAGRRTSLRPRRSCGAVSGAIGRPSSTGPSGAPSCHPIVADEGGRDPRHRHRHGVRRRRLGRDDLRRPGTPWPGPRPRPHPGRRSSDLEAEGCRTLLLIALGPRTTALRARGLHGADRPPAVGRAGPGRRRRGRAGPTVRSGRCSRRSSPSTREANGGDRAAGPPGPRVARRDAGRRRAGWRRSRLPASRAMGRRARLVAPDADDAVRLLDWRRRRAGPDGRSRNRPARHERVRSRAPRRRGLGSRSQAARG